MLHRHIVPVYTVSDEFGTGLKFVRFGLPFTREPRRNLTNSHSLFIYVILFIVYICYSIHCLYMLFYSLFIYVIYIVQMFLCCLVLRCVNLRCALCVLYLLNQVVRWLTLHVLAFLCRFVLA